MLRKFSLWIIDLPNIPDFNFNHVRWKDTIQSWSNYRIHQNTFGRLVNCNSNPKLTLGGHIFHNNCTSKAKNKILECSYWLNFFHFWQIWNFNNDKVYMIWRDDLLFTANGQMYIIYPRNGVIINLLSRCTKEVDSYVQTQLKFPVEMWVLERQLPLLPVWELTC